MQEVIGKWRSKGGYTKLPMGTFAFATAIKFKKRLIQYFIWKFSNDKWMWNNFDSLISRWWIDQWLIDVFNLWVLVNLFVKIMGNKTPVCQPYAWKTKYVEYYCSSLYYIYSEYISHHTLLLFLFHALHQSSQKYVSFSLFVVGVHRTLDDDMISYDENILWICKISGI